MGCVTPRASRGQVQHYDPSAMNPVKDLLRQLITRLEEELSAETSHKEWCPGSGGQRTQCTGRSGVPGAHLAT